MSNMGTSNLHKPVEIKQKQIFKEILLSTNSTNKTFIKNILLAHLTSLNYRKRQLYAQLVAANTFLKLTLGRLEIIKLFKKS